MVDWYGEILLIMLTVTTSVTSSQHAFPAARFFNVSQDKVKSISKYLCYENPAEQKCCSCAIEEFSENWCIDILWNKRIPRSLTAYLRLLINHFKREHDYDNQLTCEPLFHPLSHDHKSEYIPMYSAYLDDEETSHDCLFENNNVPVYNEYWDVVYVNKQCAVLDGADKYEALDISVKCKTFPNIRQNVPFNIKNANQCIFQRTPSQLMKAHYASYKCPVEKSYCPRSNENFYLCKAYYAPTRGFKNYHCYKCNARTTETSFPLDICPDSCKKGICPLYENSNDYPVTFQLTSDSRDGYVVINLNHPFPVMEFLGISKSDMSNGSIGSLLDARGLCSENFISLKLCCECVGGCMKFKSCCMDVLWDKSHPVGVEEYKQLLINTSRRYKDHECEELIPGAAQHRDNRMYFMVSACPVGANEHYKQKCLDVRSSSIQSYIPVIGTDRYLYRNSFCAQCHAVEKFEPVNITADCNIFSEAARECSFAIHGEVRFPDVIKRCENRMSWNKKCDTGSKLYELCKAYKGSLRYFANIHCHMCNLHDNNAPFIPTVTCRFIFPILLWWSMLISFSNNGQILNIRSHEGKYLDICDRGNILSIYQKQCKPDVKTPRIGLVNMKQPRFDRCLTALNTTTMFIVRKRDNTGNEDAWMDTLLLLNITKDMLQMYHEDEIVSIQRVNMNISMHTTHVIINQYDHLKSRFQMYNYSLILTPTYQPILSELHQLYFSNMFPRNRICQTPLKLSIGNANFSSTCDVIYNETKYNFSDVSMHIRAETGNITRYVAVCKSFYLVPDCKLRVIDSGITVNKDGSLTHKVGASYNSYSVGEYYPSKHGAVVCLSNYQLTSDLRTWLSIIQKVDIYASYIGTSISVFCYFIVILTFGSFEHLRNLPGMLIMGLSCSLLSGDAMFLVDGLLDITGYNKLQTLCKTVAVLMHFGLTTSHIWNMVIAYGMMVRFTTIRSRMIGDDTRTLKRYCATTFSISLLIVLTTLVFDQLGLVLIGYGDGGICAPQKFYGRLLFYVVPALISFVISFGFGIRVVYKVWKEDRSNNQTLRNSGRNNINVAVLVLKLTLVLGITEGIGFVQIVQSNRTEAQSKTNAILGLLYSFCRSLRGLVLAMLYICRKDILRLWQGMRHGRAGRSNAVGNPTVKSDSKTIDSNESENPKKEESRL